MGYNFIKNQPFVFNHDNEFCGTEQKEVCLLTEETDLLSFQAALTPQGNSAVNPTFILGTNLINDPNFEYCASNWTFTGGWGCGFFNATKAAGGAAGYCQQLGYSFQSGGYIIKLSVLSLGAGDSIDIYIGSQNVATIGTNGTHTIHIESANGGNGFKIYADVGTSVTVDDIEVYYIGWAYAAGSNWEIDEGKACHTSGAAGDLTQYILLTKGGLYQVRLTISGMTQGSLVVTLGNNGYSETFTANGTYLFYGNNTDTYPATIDDYLFKISASTDFDGCIDNCYVSEVCDNVRVSIFDLEDNFIMEIPQTFITLEKNIVNLSTTPNNLKLDEGCYRLKVINPCSADGEEMIPNGDFQEDTDYWQWQDINDNTTTVRTLYLATLYSLNTNFTGSDTVTIQHQGVTTMVVGKKYKICYKIGLDTGTSLSVEIDGNTYNHTGPIFTTNGQTFCHTFTAASTSSIVEFICTGGTGDWFNIYDLSVVLIPEDYTYVYESNCFNVKEVHDCTKLFVWSDTKNGYGFYYGLNPITFNLRLLAEYRRERYVQGVTNFDDTTYKTATIFATSREYKEVNIDSYPITIHRCIAIARLHKTFTIDGVISYPEIVDYEPTWNNFSKKFAQARFFVYQSTEQFNNCGTDFTADQDYLIDPETGDCVISLE
jgi:hypothetical protein